jgi:ribosomal protein L24E
LERCLYCGKKIKTQTYHVKVSNNTYPVCSEKCQSKAEEYIEKDKKHKTILYITMFFSCIGILVVSLFNDRSRIFYAIQICVGAAFLILPYPINSYDSLHNCSIKKLRLICRILGLFLIVFGIYLSIML